MLISVKWTIPVYKKGQAFEVPTSIGMMLLASQMLWGYFAPIFGLDLPSLVPGIPSTLMEILGVALEIWAIVLVVGSFVSLKHHGAPSDQWESTTQLVRAFPYSVIRHPMLGGSAFMIVAFFFANEHDLGLGLRARGRGVLLGGVARGGADESGKVRGRVRALRRKSTILELFCALVETLTRHAREGSRISRGSPAGGRRE